ncbi:MAG: SDR family oxidoreductase [Oscillospiraceae bacterium]
MQRTLSRRRRDRYSAGHAARRRVRLRQDEQASGVLRRACHAEDLADAILFLASDQSRYVNGEELKCDGGWTCF